MDDDALRRDEELDAIRAMYGDDVAVLPAQNAQRAAFLVTMRLPDVLVGAHPVAVTMEVPLGYPSSAGLVVTVDWKGADRSAARQVAADAAAAQTAGEESIFQVVEEVKGLCEALSAATAAEENAVDAPPAAQFGRRLMYSHHIINGTKRKDIKEWALELRLGAVCKIGWPGIIICEGDEGACREYVTRLQAHRWKHFVVRGEEVVDVPPGGSVDDLRALGRGYIELGEDDMKALAAMCKEAGLEELFMTCMKVYK
eukprot:TRINITY_DN14273_c0_g1_i2.p1 TRINITY_DN14273_c0_g1~~TRINITY_DN14273_c0_g1_i2.p1  ORF type:complete len:256 (+),score=99.27 TRINITY_DN14273_c0_g1_i2:58-825(+)